MSLDSPTSLKPLDEQAADWAARLDGGPLTRAEADALQTWLDSAEGNEALLEEFQRLHGRIRTTLPAMAQGGRLSSPGTSRPVRAQRLVGAWTTGLAAAAALAVGVLWYANRPEEYATVAANRQSITLADGTHADLNARTSLTVRLRGSERRVFLQSGEAYFDVAKDPARPFFVETPGGTVRVTGTHFNVRADDSTPLEVTVIEGSVAVKAGDATEHALKTQDQLAFNGVDTAVQQLASGAAEDVIAWREGRIVFDGVPIRVAIERFSRYHGRPIEVSPQVETLRLGGRFRLDDFDGFLRDVALAVPVTVLRNPDGKVRIIPR